MKDQYCCDDCGYTADVNEFPMAKRLFERLLPGYTYTDVECPKCGALAFPVEEEPDEGSEPDASSRSRSTFTVYYGIPETDAISRYLHEKHNMQFTSSNGGGDIFSLSAIVDSICDEAEQEGMEVGEYLKNKEDALQALSVMEKLLEEGIDYVEVT